MSNSGMDGGGRSGDSPSHSAGGDGGAAAADKSTASSGGESSDSTRSGDARATDSDRSQRDNGDGAGRDSDDAKSDSTRGDTATHESGGDQVEFASSRGSDATPRYDQDKVDFASSRTPDTAAGGAGRSDTPQRTAEDREAAAQTPRSDDSRPGDSTARRADEADSDMGITGQESNYSYDAGLLANQDLPEMKWREATPEDRRRMVESFHGDLSARRLEGADINAPELEIRTPRVTETAGYQPDGRRRVLINEALLNKDDPSAAIGAVAKAIEFDWQTQRVDHKLDALESEAQKLEDVEFRRDTFDWEDDSRYDVFDPGRAEANSRVVAARAVEADVCGDFWRQKCLDRSAGGPAHVDPAREVEPGSPGDAAYKDDRDLPGPDVAACRDAGDALAEACPLERWEAADAEDRRKIVVEANRIIRDRYGLDAGKNDADKQPLRIEDLPDGVLGKHDDSDDSIHVSPSLLDDDDPHRVFRTLLHENRHSFQQHDNLRPDSVFRPAFLGYKGYDPETMTPKDWVEYAHSRLEWDAHYGASRGMEAYWKTVWYRQGGERV